MPLIDPKSTHPFETVKELHPTDFSPEGLRRWLLRITEILDVTPTELAKKANIAPSTVNRFIQGKGESSNLGARTIKKLTDALLPLHLDRYNAPYDYSGRAPDFIPALVRVLATIRIGVFRENHIWSPPDQFMVQIPLPPALAFSLVGFAVADDEATTVYPYGSIVIGAAVDEKSTFVTGERYVISRSNERNETELSLRELVISPNEDAWLTTLSGRGRKRTPDVYLGKLSHPDFFGSHGGDGYSLEYKVVSSVRPEPTIFDKVAFI